MVTEDVIWLMISLKQSGLSPTYAKLRIEFFVCPTTKRLRPIVRSLGYQQHWEHVCSHWSNIGWSRSISGAGSNDLDQEEWERRSPQSQIELDDFTISISPIPSTYCHTVTVFG